MTNRAGTAAPYRLPDALVLAVIVTGALIGLYGWLMFATVFGHDGTIGPRYNAPGTDYMVYWSAARAAMEGNFALLNDPAALTAQINRQFQGWLTAPLPLHPWLYPPHFLIILMPFAILPFPASYLAFQVASFAAAAAAGLHWARCARWRVLWLVGLALMPATAFNLIVGQNALLTLALLLGGASLLGRSDLRAGLIFGLLSYKPQFAILIPVALLAGRHWRALAGAVISSLLGVVLSAAVFGLDPWAEWLGNRIPSAAGGGAGEAWPAMGRIWGLSAWASASVLGAPGWLAHAAQVAAVLLGAGCVWIAYRRPFERDRRMAVLLVATLVAAPHSLQYDLVLLGAATLLLCRNLLDNIAIPLTPSLLLVPWAAPFAAVPNAAAWGFAVPVTMLGLLLTLSLPPRSERFRAPQHAPAPRTR